MLAVSYFFSHATAGFIDLFLHLLKVLCMFFARPRPSFALDPPVSDHVVIMKVASITLLNRSIKYKQYCSNAVQIELQSAEWPSRLAKLASNQIQAVSPSITFFLSRSQSDS